MYETKLTWGEISRMTDEEIIAGSKAADYAVNTEYKFVVYTDATGNNIVNICTIKSIGEHFYTANVTEKIIL